MEDNKNLESNEVVTTEASTQNLSEVSTTVIEETSNDLSVSNEVVTTETVVTEVAPVVEEQSVQDIVVSPEFASADVVATEQMATPQAELTKPKKKVNKTLIIVLVIVVIFGGAMLLMNQGGKAPVNGPVDQEGEKKIEYNVGSDWGNKYFSYLMESKSELTTYEVSFIDVNADDVPEMFVKYIDNTEKESLKIFYIAEDDEVYETKAYRDYRIRFIYSLEHKTIDWYLYLTSSKQYGTYTMISKIIDEMAFDADIKATNDNLLIQYGKKYYDTDYQPVFYNIKANNQEGDFRDFVKKYDIYKQKVIDEKTKVETKYYDYEYKEDVKVEKDSVGLAGRIYKYGNYYGAVHADPEYGIVEHTVALVLNKDGTIILGGVLETYTIDQKKGNLVTSSNKVIELIGSNVFKYNNVVYKYETDSDLVNSNANTDTTTDANSGDTNTE